MVAVSVENYVIDTGARDHEAVPVRDGVEIGVVDSHGRVAVAIANGAPAIVVEFLKCALVKVWAHWLVQEFNSCDYVRWHWRSGLRDFGGRPKFGRPYRLVTNQQDRSGLSYQDRSENQELNKG